METIVELLLFAAATAWFSFAALCWLGLRRVPDLRPLHDRAACAAPRVLAVVCARDEERRIGTTIDRLLAQRGVDLEVVAVDDRSTDRTGAVIDRAAAADPRVHALHVDHLPDGWLGKCHACHFGVHSADPREWILFTDADAWMSDDVVARAVADAELERADHVCLVPHMSGTTALGRAVATVLGLGLTRISATVNRERGRSYIGIGAFNLVRREPYEAVGGHERLRLEVLDDIGLAFLLRRSGYRSRIRFSLDSVQVEWVTDTASLFRVTEKNYFAALRFRVDLAAAIGVVSSAMWIAGLLGPLHGTVAGLTAGAGLWSLVIPAIAIARRYRWPWTCGLLAPLVFPIVVASILYSAARTLLRGGIRWRGTFYPLAQLRAGVVRRAR